MKKTYKSPKLYIVSIDGVAPIAVSEPKVGLQTEETPVDGSDLDVKGISVGNIWDREW